MTIFFFLSKYALFLIAGQLFIEELILFYSTSAI